MGEPVDGAVDVEISSETKLSVPGRGAVAEQPRRRKHERIPRGLFLLTAGPRSRKDNELCLKNARVQHGWVSVATRQMLRRAEHRNHLPAKRTVPESAVTTDQRLSPLLRAPNPVDVRLRELGLNVLL